MSRLTRIWGRSDAHTLRVTVPAPPGATSSFPVRPTTVRGAPQLYHAKWQAVRMRRRKPTRKTQRGLRAHGGNRLAAGHTPFGGDAGQAQAEKPIAYIWESRRPNTKNAWCRDFWIATGPSTRLNARKYPVLFPRVCGLRGVVVGPAQILVLVPTRVWAAGTSATPTYRRNTVYPCVRSLV